MAKMTLGFPLAVAALLTVSACGGGGGSAEAIKKACLGNTNSPPEACQCLGDGAEERLTPAAAEWLALALAGKTDEAVKLKDDIPVGDLLAASMYLVNYSQECAIEGPLGELP